MKYSPSLCVILDAGMGKRGFVRTFRLAGLLIGIAAVVIIVTALAILFRIRIANEWQQYAHVPAMTAPGKGDSIIIFAPHSDDETLGCGGMLATAVRNGADARVVLVTNGDGFWFAVSRAFKTIRLTPKKFIEFAYRRQQETLKALKTLGVTRRQVTFLGYPDRAVARLWDKNWSPDSLYTSRATRLDHSPYTNAFTRHAPYCGDRLIKDIEEILKRSRPTDIYIPHPLDNHPDHYATYCFTTAAVEQLKYEHLDFARKIRVHTYLVHRGDWPAPRGDRPKSYLAPPFALARGGTKWSSLALTPEIADLKREAIRKYRTQMAVERGFLMSFARANEIFGSLPERKVAHVKPARIVIDGLPEDWSGIPPSLADPIGDYVVAGMNKGGDIRSIYMAEDGRYLYLRLDCVTRLSRRIAYMINLRGINGVDSGSSSSVSIRPPSYCSPPVADWAYKGNMLEVALPLDKLEFDHDIFVQVITKTMRLTVDNTGWNGVEFGGSREQGAEGSGTPRALSSPK